MSEESTFKVILIGDAGTGKTHLLNRYVKGTIPKQSQPTIGVEFSTKVIPLKNGTEVKVSFWDTAGQERYRAITVSHYRKSIGALLVYDITKENTFDNINKWLEDLKLQAEPDIQIMLVGNMLDLVEENPSERKIQTSEAEQFANDNNLMFMETSALTTHNVNNAFETLIEQIYNVKNNNANDANKGEPIYDLIQDKNENEQKTCSC